MVDRSDIRQVVSDFRQEKQVLFRQWLLWLGLGSAGGAVAFISLAAALPNPDHAFHIFSFSLWSFLTGVITAGICLLFASFRAQHTEEHFAAAHNRDELSDMVNSITEMISSPPSIADRANLKRNHYLEKAEEAERIAETSWGWRNAWHRVIVLCQIISGLAFVAGVAWPLLYVSTGGALVPPDL